MCISMQDKLWKIEQAIDSRKNYAKQKKLEKTEEVIGDRKSYRKQKKLEKVIGNRKKL